MAGPSVTNTFANSTTADASQVNQNFTDLINGATDGTKDYSINALTCAGTATLNGNVNLGNASGDDLTITASLASTLNIKTTYSYDIGSSTIGLRKLYLGASDSSAHTLALQVGAVATSYTLTLPTAVAAANNSVIEFTTGGVGSFRQLKVPTVQLLTAGTSYTAPSGVKWLRVRMVGGGAGGAGSGTAGGVTGIQNGGDTTWSDGTITATAGGGTAGTRGGNGGSGGAATLTGVTGLAVVGEQGDASTGVQNMPGGRGGRSFFPGAGGASAGAAASSNASGYGSGGTGGGLGATAAAFTGAGGGAGAFLEFIVPAPANATIAIGAGGNGANAGTSGFGGSNGLAGVIYVEEFYQ
jgi:hypothetical protein